MKPKEMVDIVKSFIAEDTKLSQCGVFLCRYDGVVVYSTKTKEFGRDESSIGALISGVWQAAHSLSNFVKSDEEGMFRLSFDTSDSGVYILPIIKGPSEKYFLGLLYNEEINPGQLKSRARNLIAHINEIKIGPTDTATKVENPLFEDITDDEIDQMFSMAGI